MVIHCDCVSFRLLLCIFKPEKRENSLFFPGLEPARGQLARDRLHHHTFSLFSFNFISAGNLPWFPGHGGVRHQLWAVCVVCEAAFIALNYSWSPAAKIPFRLASAPFACDEGLFA